MKKLSIILATVLAVLFATTALAVSSAPTSTAHSFIEGTVTDFVSGNTIVVATDDKQSVKVRLYGIDAPTISHGKLPGQPLAEEAKKFLFDSLAGKKIKMHFVNFDKFYRAVCVVYVNDMNVNLEMVKNGFAEVRDMKNIDLDMYKKEETIAKTLKKGIWGLDKYESPKAFRKRLNIKMKE